MSQFETGGVPTAIMAVDGAYYLAWKIEDKNIPLIEELTSENTPIYVIKK